MSPNFTRFGDILPNPMSPDRSPTSPNRCPSGDFPPDCPSCSCSQPGDFAPNWTSHQVTFYQIVAPCNQIGCHSMIAKLVTLHQIIFLFGNFTPDLCLGYQIGWRWNLVHLVTLHQMLIPGNHIGLSNLVSLQPIWYTNGPIWWLVHYGYPNLTLTI